MVPSDNEKFDNELKNENLGTSSVEKSQQKQTEILGKQTRIIENQTEILDQQTKFTKILTLATIILALTAVYQFLFSIPSTLILAYGEIPNPDLMWKWMIIEVLIFLFLAAILYFILSYKKK